MVGESSRPLTVEDLREGMRRIEQGDQIRAEQARAKARAWASLDLDYDAMTQSERDTLAWAQANDVISPLDFKRAEQIINRYRRDL